MPTTTSTDTYDLGDGRVVTVELDIETGVDDDGFETNELMAARYLLDGRQLNRDEAAALITEARRNGATPA